MIQSYKYEDKNEELALKKCLEDLNLTKDDIYVNVKEIEGGLFKKSKQTIEVIKKDDVILYIKEYIKRLAEEMNIIINSEVREIDDSINVILVSDNNPILIGKEGRTLDAIQHLLKQALKNLTNNNIRISVDASNYKAKKTRNFEYEIKSIAKEVLNTKIEVKLDSMNSYQRRLVHTLIGDFPNLETESVGEEPNRCVIIKHVEK